MKITIYTRLENLDEIRRRLIDINNSSPISPDLFTTENAQRTHFQGWCQLSIPYDDYVRLVDLQTD